MYLLQSGYKNASNASEIVGRRGKLTHVDFLCFVFCFCCSDINRLQQQRLQDESSLPLPLACVPPLIVNKKFRRSSLHKIQYIYAANDFIDDNAFMHSMGKCEFLSCCHSCCCCVSENSFLHSILFYFHAALHFFIVTHKLHMSIMCGDWP